jgi:hypothetical protein
VTLLERAEEHAVKREFGKARDLVDRALAELE